jgi:hypothetical protein
LLSSILIVSHEVDHPLPVRQELDVVLRIDEVLIVRDQVSQRDRGIRQRVSIGRRDFLSVHRLGRADRTDQ